MANTDPKAQRAINDRAAAAILEARQFRITRLRACCAPLAVVGVDQTHSPDVCAKCQQDAAAIQRGSRI
jgi:hypothetical protein